MQMSLETSFQSLIFRSGMVSTINPVLETIRQVPLTCLEYGPNARWWDLCGWDVLVGVGQLGRRAGFHTV